MRALVVKLLKDPLLHFLVIGVALFAASAWRGQSIRAGRERIVLTAEQVAQARDAATALKGRALLPELGMCLLCNDQRQVKVGIAIGVMPGVGAILRGG